MSDWNILNAHRVREPKPSLRIDARYCTDESAGFNGMFRLPWKDKMLRVVASDGLGWQHVSVSIERENKTPSWEMMCAIKDLFWEPEDWVMQFHPAQSQYVNFHPGCLHLWKPVGKDFPTPDSILVGPRRKTIDNAPPA